AAVLITNPAGLSQRPQLLHQERSFFGVHRVMLAGSRTFHELVHGTTLHGAQRYAPRACDQPLTYYHRSGPAGDVFRELPAKPRRRVAVAGLGTGALAAYAEPGEHWTFYEIDPAVRRIASDTSYFCYLAACRGAMRIVLGDARRSIAATPQRYDLMV